MCLRFFRGVFCCFFFFNDTATTEIYTLSLHDALPISIDFRAVAIPQACIACGGIDVQPRQMPEAWGPRVWGLVDRLVLEVVPRLDVPDRPALRAHHHRVRLGAPLEEAHAAQEIAAGHAAGGEDDVPARHLLHPEDFVDVGDAHLLRPLDLLVVARLEPALHVAAHAADGRGGDDALGRAADAHEHVDARLGKAGGDGRRDVAVADELDARPGGADLRNELFVPRPVEDDDREIVDVEALAVGDGAQVL